MIHLGARVVVELGPPKVDAIREVRAELAAAAAEADLADADDLAAAAAEADLADADADAGAAAVEHFDCQFSEDEIDVPAPAAPVCQVPALDPDFASVPLADAGSFDCGGDLDVFCRALGIKIAPREYIWV